MKLCHHCKRELQPGRSIGRREVCPFCGADVHCCLNCSFYDRLASKQCREPMVELVKIKERANYCDYFTFADAPESSSGETEAEKARKALEDLFRK